MKIVSPLVSCILVAFIVTGRPFSAAAQQARKTTMADLEKRKSGRKQPGSIACIQDGTAVASFRDRLEFFTLSPNISFDPGTGQMRNAKGIVEPIGLEPTKIMWFDEPYGLQAAGKNMLVCADAARPPMSARHPMDFCGIISITGDIIFKFPVKQHSPDTLLQIIAISSGGIYAEVYIGRLINGEDGPEIGAPREILAWRYPNKLTRFPGPWKKGTPKDPFAAYEEVRQGFKDREKQH